MPVLSQTIADLVAADGVPRQATADDGSVHMLFRDGDVVRSVLLVDWPAEQAAQAARDADRQLAIQTRQRVLSIAQSAVGVAFDQLTAAQIKALVGLLLHMAGALDKDGKVKALGEWVR